MKNKYPEWNKIPYKDTKVSANRTQAQISSLLEKYGISNQQWTKLENQGESLKFIFDSFAQGKQIKKAIKIVIPVIKAIRGRYSEVVTVPKEVVYRMLYYALKSILETSEYGLMTLDELLLSFTLTQLENGRVTTIKEALNQRLLLPESSIEL